jgi:NAD(P)-dependent dehydrogenase (short-subunit alcohol dehydrogenase family)
MLQGKTIVITGANGALGRGAVAVATQHNARVIEFDIAFDADAENRYVVDLTKPETVRSCVAEVGTIDAVLNIAGGFAMGPPIYETSEDEWQHMYRMNVLTMRNMVDAVVPGMIERGRGSIVNVGALSAREGQANMGAYVAAKSTVMRVTEGLGKELRKKGINVNAILPSMIDTPTNRKDMPDADFSKWVPPSELAEVMCFLASDRARAVHGALIPVAGLS